MNLHKFDHYTSLALDKTSKLNTAILFSCYSHSALSKAAAAMASLSTMLSRPAPARFTATRLSPRTARMVIVADGARQGEPVRSPRTDYPCGNCEVAARLVRVTSVVYVCEAAFWSQRAPYAWLLARHGGAVTLGPLWET